ncbi:MAG: type II toxin-antitoxin system VapC family toxin [Defluviitaleaceae bacterium]|nr:type II toxin-antitoxin system VapC family toxin [Defluviitaleaceae bacterium]
MKSLYIETTIPSLATSKPSRDMIIAGRQAATIFFWENERHKFDLYTSQYVIDECLQGNSEAAKRRLEFLKGVAIIPRSVKISELANEYQTLLSIPDKSKIDCFHLAVCVIAEMDYLMSWNCAHLGINTFIKIQKYNEGSDLFTPVLLTPEALLEI